MLKRSLGADGDGGGGNKVEKIHTESYFCLLNELLGVSAGKIHPWLRVVSFPCLGSSVRQTGHRLRSDVGQLPRQPALCEPTAWAGSPTEAQSLLSQAVL